ncbi:MAG: response regulator [Anaerolineales bacterium]
MSISSKVREQLLNSFRAELAEHIQTITEGLLTLEQQGHAASVDLDAIFRAAHSLKGAARAVGATVIEQLAHALEDMLDGLRKERIAPSPDFFNGCYRAMDAIQAVQADYEAGAVTPSADALEVLQGLEAFRRAPAPTEPGSRAPTPAEERTPAPVPAPAGTGELDETIRVKVSKLDALMAQLSELFITKIQAEQRLAQLREIEGQLALWQKEWLSVRSAYTRLLRQEEKQNNGKGEDRDRSQMITYVGASQEYLREMHAQLSDLSREYANDTMHMSLVIDELEEEVKRVRMLPLHTITPTFGRMVRDLAKAAGKEAVLRIRGGETELDKRVLEQIKDPLIHLLRNAVDHGIETPEKREAAGKARTGHITLTAEQLGRDVVITVADDGSGLDIEAIREAVTERKGTLERELGEVELVEAIFAAGVSTSAFVTDISGRGIGLDVVRRNIEDLRGRISVDWTPGGGTEFTLVLPVTLSSSRGLLVRTAGERYAVPLNAIERILTVRPEQVSPFGGQSTILYGERPLTLVRLSDVLELPDNGAGRGATELVVVVLAAAERRMAFIVDELVGEQEIVIKPLGKQLASVGGLAGATVLGSGEIVLVLNAADLLKLALREGQGPLHLQRDPDRAPSKERQRRHILIVDDSLTTRTLEKNILEAAGYSIEVATDGQEAWNLILASSPLPDLVISDVSMPRLDGIGLTRRIREETRTTELPVILVTSLDSPADKARGVEAGADAYITKGSFNQHTLLDVVEQLL